MRFPEDAGLVGALRSFDIAPDALLGHGGEAWVYALDAERIVRVHHAGTVRETVDHRTSLLAELARSVDAVPFRIPGVLETSVVDERIVTIEPRLPGRPLLELLRESKGSARAALLRSYLDAAARIGDLRVERPWYGDLAQSVPIHTGSFREYLRRRAARSLAGAGPDFARLDPDALADALPEAEAPDLVHLDAFPGNMLGDGSAVTAVLDFGVIALVGDRRLDPLAAVAYLAPNITPTANPTDRALAREWLAERGLAELYEPARRWLAAFWSIARDDRRLHEWCREVLLPA